MSRPDAGELAECFWQELGYLLARFIRRILKSPTT